MILECPQRLKVIGSPGMGIGTYSRKLVNYVRNALSIEFDTYKKYWCPTGMDREFHKIGNGHLAFSLKAITTAMGSIQASLLRQPIYLMNLAHVDCSLNAAQ